MELANSKFGSELSNNYYGADARPSKPKPIAIATTTTIKPAPTTGKTGPTTTTPASTGTGFRPSGPVSTPVAETTPTPVSSTIPPVSTPGGGGGSGGGSSEEKAPEEKAAETGTKPVESISFFRKPIGKVSILIAVAALLYGGYRVMKSK